MNRRGEGQLTPGDLEIMRKMDSLTASWPWRIWAWSFVPLCSSLWLEAKSLRSLEDKALSPRELRLDATTLTCLGCVRFFAGFHCFSTVVGFETSPSYNSEYQRDGCSERTKCVRVPSFMAERSLGIAQTPAGVEGFASRGCRFRNRRHAEERQAVCQACRGCAAAQFTQ